MQRRTAIVWGAIGGLSFLVILQAYELLTGIRVSITAKFGIAILATLTATVLVRRLATRINENRRA